jgi:hypothetical protein
VRTAAAPTSNRVVSTRAESDAAGREPCPPQQTWPSTCRSLPSSLHSRRRIAQATYWRRRRRQPRLGQTPASRAAPAGSCEQGMPVVREAMQRPQGWPKCWVRARPAVPSGALIAAGLDFRDEARVELSPEAVWTIGGPAAGIVSWVFPGRSTQMNVHRPHARAARQWTRCEERRLETTAGSATRRVTRRGRHVE